MLSLIIWALVLVVAVKYMFFVIRADNKGEGGILSIMALARSGFESRPAWILALGRDGSFAVLRRCDPYAGAVGSIRG